MFKCCVKYKCWQASTRIKVFSELFLWNTSLEVKFWSLLYSKRLCSRKIVPVSFSIIKKIIENNY